MSLVRKGIVVSTGPSTVRVKFEDSDGLVSYDLPVICKRTGKDKELVIPDVGELVVCIFTEEGGVDGFVLGSHYNQSDVPPQKSAQSKSFHYTCEDGAVIEYDRETGTLTAENIKVAKIIAKESIEVTVPTVTINGDLKVNGSASFSGDAHSDGNISTSKNITADGKIIDKSGNSNNHSH